MPRGRNAKEARRAKREKPRANGPPSRSLVRRASHHDDSDDSDQEMDLRDLMTFAVMAKALQEGLGFEDSDDDGDIPHDFEPTYDDMEYFESGGAWPPPSMMGCPFGMGRLMALAGGNNSSGITIGEAVGAVGYEKKDVPGLNVDYIDAISHKLNKKKKLKHKECERRAKIEDVKDWAMKPRAWGPSDKNNIILIQLKNNSTLDQPILTPGQITEIVMYNDVFHRSSEHPRLNLNKNLIAVLIDKSEDINELLKLESLSLDVTQSASVDEESCNSDLDDSLLEEDNVPVRCFRPLAKAKDERWWEDKKKYILINQQKPLKFSNDQIFEESNLHSIVSWSRALKMEDEFFLGFCQRCSNFSSPSQKMFVCNACHLVAYCNKNCQKKDRNRHKKLCSAYSINHCNMNVFERALKEVRNTQTPETRKEYIFVFLCHIDADPTVLTSKPLGLEKLDYIRRVIYGLRKSFTNDCLQYPRICNVCFKADKSKLKECECYCVAYCSEEHRDSDMKHKLICKDLLKIARVYAFCKKKTLEEQNLFLPHDLGIYHGADVISKPLDNMDDLVHPRHFPSGSQPDEWLDVKLALLSQRLAMPLTILHLLEKGGLGPDKTSVNAVEKLTIHILCEQPFLDPSSWEFFLHRLPKLKKLNLIFCSNNTNPGGSINKFNTCKMLQRCKKCEEAGRLITFTLYPGMYEHLLNIDLENPDIVYAINPEDLIEVDNDGIIDSDEDFDNEDDDYEDVSSDDENMDVNRENFYRNITMFEKSGLIVANECKKKMLTSYRGVCKFRSIELVKVNGFSYDRKNPFSGFSPVRRKFDNRSHTEEISNNQSFVAYLTRSKENSKKKSINASDIWGGVGDDDDDDDDEDYDLDDFNKFKFNCMAAVMSHNQGILSNLGNKSNYSDMPDLIDGNKSDESDLPDLIEDGSD